jgi:DNA gyrase subunit A
MAEIEWDANRNRIVVTGFRNEDSLEVLAEKLHYQINERQIQGVSDLRNDSTEDTTLLVIQLKRDANADAILDHVSRNLPPE